NLLIDRMNLKSTAVASAGASGLDMRGFRLKKSARAGKTCAPERWPSGLRRTLGKRVYGNTVPWGRIPLSPPPTQGSPAHYGHPPVNFSLSSLVPADISASTSGLRRRP